ncbi:nucleolar complex protein 2 homolog [Lingula anatina]|uniref:Nucleolar complex protein 2 homolog n=1 Tax=Lingula anatina TaxID=7574 RepID=A0A1S3JII8_LINAN|nr:nucleolar complex protein 2 homolog [Lingula anatina]|eukprot:XP_013410225.1 nucleolar complex protein 2 homolog [Lingula anatina]
MASAKKRKLAELSVEEFMQQSFDTGSEDTDTPGTSSEQGTNQHESKKKKKKQLKKNAKKIEKGSKKVDQDPNPSSKKTSEASKHKQSLGKLKDSDPEFYEFLKGEDKELLDFDLSGDEDDGTSDEEQVHKVPSKLEVASDDSEGELSIPSSDEDESESKKKTKKKISSRTLVTLKMVNHWTQSLQEGSSLSILHDVVAAFKAAVQQAGGEDDAEVNKYKVEGSTVFNAIVRLCLTELLPAWRHVLALPETKENKKPPLPSTSKQWAKVRLDVKLYLTELIRLLSEVGESTIVNILLKHVHQLVPFIACFPKVARIVVKKLISLWSSTSEETCRVLSFLSINKLVRLMQNALLEPTLKQMYMAYVQNCKFTSPSTLPMINFMQRSLVEMFAIDVRLTYQYAFIYIRQLAIHLRNAITVKKKDTCQAVYNWQYVHCLYLWARLLSTVYPSDTLEPLIYPLTQTIIGTIKLIPTAKYYPLRFHCIKTLNMLSKATNTFIPVLPFILEVLEQTDFNKKHSKASFRPLNFTCILKVSKAQLQEKAFKDGLIDQVYELLLETFYIHAHTIGFPELVLPAVMQLKESLKKCKVANYCRQLKQVLEKVNETSKVIGQRRKEATFDLKDPKSVDAWDRKSKEEGTPLGKFYAQWRKLRDTELQHEIAGKERISTDKLPEVVRQRGPQKATADERKEFSALFDSESEESMDDETSVCPELLHLGMILSRFQPKSERQKKKKKKETKEESDSEEDYSDFDSDELEQLAGDGSEEDPEEEEEEESGDNEEGDEEMESENSEEEEEEEQDAADVVEDFELSDDSSD